jgi:hypothetical protein
MSHSRKPQQLIDAKQNLTAAEAELTAIKSHIEHLPASPEQAPMIDFIDLQLAALASQKGALERATQEIHRRNVTARRGGAPVPAGARPIDQDALLRSAATTLTEYEDTKAKALADFPSAAPAPLIPPVLADPGIAAPYVAGAAALHQPPIPPDPAAGAGLPPDPAAPPLRGRRGSTGGAAGGLPFVRPDPIAGRPRSLSATRHPASPPAPPAAGGAVPAGPAGAAPPLPLAGAAVAAPLPPAPGVLPPLPLAAAAAAAPLPPAAAVLPPPAPAAGLAPPAAGGAVPAGPAGAALPPRLAGAAAAAPLPPAAAVLPPPPAAPAPSAAVPPSGPLPAAPAPLPTAAAYAGTQQDLDTIHANIKKYEDALKLYSGMTKLALRSANHRLSLLKQQKQIEDDLKKMHALINFYQTSPLIPAGASKHDVNSLMLLVTESLRDLQTVKSTSQDKMLRGSGMVHAEYTTGTVDDARKVLEKTYLLGTGAPGTSGITSTGRGGEVSADFKKPFMAVHVVNVGGGVESRTGTLQHYDSKTKQLHTEYHLKPDHIKEIGQLPREGNILTGTYPHMSIIRDTLAKIDIHRAHPEGATGPILINGAGLHPDEIEAHFIICKMRHIPINPHSEVLCNFKMSSVTQKTVDKVKAALEASYVPGVDFTMQEAKEIPAELHTAISKQTTKPQV